MTKRPYDENLGLRIVSLGSFSLKKRDLEDFDEL